MSYKYEDLKPEVFLEANQRDFLAIRDKANMLLNSSGVFRMQEAIREIAGDTWLHMAMVDRLVELGEIVEIKQAGDHFGQSRIFKRSDR